jgi:dihydropyrimidine dehydrogenase (NAD+) subunit PreA
MAVRKDLTLDYIGVRCPNPFFLGASPASGSYEMLARAFDAGWGGAFFKTVGVTAADECSPRLDNTSKDGVPWLGLKNMEQTSEKPAEENFENILRLKQDFPDKVMIATIMGNSNEEWTSLAKMCEQAGVDLIEGNFSGTQPENADVSGDIGSNPRLVKQYTKAVTKATEIPFIAKMTPNLTAVEPVAKAAIEGGARGISAINTVKSITNIDLDSFTALPVINGKSAVSGYSGAAIRPIALRFVSDLLSDPELAEVPVSGAGGIETWRDALEFLLLGCRNVQVTTAVMQYGYLIVEDMISGLSHWMAERGYEKLDDFIGLALPNIIPFEEIDRSFQILPKFDERKCTGCGRCYISCYDGAHQAISWNEKKRLPELDNDRCVGCHLCLNVCPVAGCITPGDVKWKKNAKRHKVAVQQHFD